MEKKKLESGHECWEINLREAEEKGSCSRSISKENLEFLLETLKEATESQVVGTMYDSEGNIIPNIECPEDKYTLHVVGQDFRAQVLMDKGEPCTFNYCPPKKESNKE